MEGEWWDVRGGSEQDTVYDGGSGFRCCEWTFQFGVWPLSSSVVMWRVIVKVPFETTACFGRGSWGFKRGLEGAQGEERALELWSGYLGNV